MGFLESFFSHAYTSALIGGLCIGLSTILMMTFLGRIAGISGIAFNALSSPLKNSWAVVFLLGLGAGAFIFHLISGRAIPALDVPLPLLLTGGFLVGFGTKLGSGCTSGHGICGIGRLSTRSILASCTFMVCGFVTVYLRLHGDTL